MGLPVGWVTDVPDIPRNAQLKALGNGVVPQQAALALAMLGVGRAVVPPPTDARLLPTPTSGDSVGTGYATEQQQLTKADQPHRLRDAANAIRLLPTPVVNDMGAGKTVEQWDEWTHRMRDSHRNGNGHGPSLSIELARLASS